MSDVSEAVAEQVTIQLKYSGYIDRQQQDVDRLQRHESMPIPGDWISIRLKACPMKFVRS